MHLHSELNCNDSFNVLLLVCKCWCITLALIKSLVLRKLRFDSFNAFTPAMELSNFISQQLTVRAAYLSLSTGRELMYHRGSLIHMLLVVCLSLEIQQGL